MIKKFHFLLIILTFGFFATPTLTYACGTNSNKTEKSCCNKDKAKRTDKKDCCKSPHSNNNINDDGCDGKCKHTSCSCSTSHFAFNLPFTIELKFKNCFVESEKNKFYDKQIYLSDGFYTIWTPPNIG